jgi:nitroimidazol reductase NimA-like FMN-containing flavoprotein (pyridoxamine 5'-phosphate oxidase superfamily)
MTEPRATELDVDACLALLGGHHLGRIAVNGPDGPTVLPVNYVLDRGAVVFRTDEGTKLDAAVRGEHATFEVDHVDEGRREAWSVVIHGKVEEVTEPAELDVLRQLPLEPFVGGEKAHYVRVPSAAITGRRIRLPGRVPMGWFEPTDLGTILSGVDGDDAGLS